MAHKMFKLGQYAEKIRRRLSRFDYLAKEISGVTLNDGIEETTINQDDARFGALNTTFDHNSSITR